MACNLTTGFAVGCNDSIGGVAEFWIANMPTDFAAATDGSGEVTGLSGTGLEYFKFECTNAQGASSLMNDNPTVNDANGTSFLTKLQLTFSTKWRKLSVMRLK